MTPAHLLGMGLLVAALLPSLIAASERRRLPDLFRALLAIAGLGYGWATGGGTGLAFGLASCLGTLLVLAALVAFTQKCAGVRLLSGGEIKQIAGGAAWLYPLGAAAYLLAVLAAGLIAGALERKLAFRLRREGLVALSSIALLIIFARAG